MIYNKELKYVFVAIPKNGTRALYKVLRQKYNAIGYSIDGGKTYEDHLHIVPKEMKDFCKFTSVRNPYERFISMWWSTCKRPLKPGAGASFRTLAGGNDIKTVLSWMIKCKHENKINKENIWGHQLLLTQSTYLNQTNFDVILEVENLDKDFLTKLEFTNPNEIITRENSTVISTKNNGPARSKNIFDHIKDNETLDMINYYYAEDFNNLPQYNKLKVIL